MRLPIALAALALALAQSVAADAPMDVHLDVPQDKGPQRVNVLVREFPVGGGSGWHIHPGTEIAYLLQGEMSLEEAGKPRRVLKPGDSFTVARGVPHNGANLGQVPARLVITYVVDKDAPVRTAVEPPREHLHH